MPRALDYTHPRKGTETRRSSTVRPPRQSIILIPARGRKLGGTSGERWFSSIILIPARGRKLCLYFGAQRVKERLYSSPQGDGNPPAGWGPQTRGDYTHPRKGTETIKNMDSSPLCVDYTHPRKGTETLCQGHAPRFLRIILIPARGQKPKKGNHNEFTKFHRI